MQAILAKVFEVPIEKTAAIMIHLQRAKEREPKIAALQQAIQTNFEIFHAIDGSLVEDHPTACALAGATKPAQRTAGEAGSDALPTKPAVQRTAGELGCLLSHVQVAREALRRGLEVVAVFEDDCEPGPACRPIDLFGWLNSVTTFFKSFSWPGTRDLILLGTGGTYDLVPLTQFFKGTRQFNCTHAYVMRRPMMQRLIDTYEHLKGRGQMAPIDGLLGLMLRAEKKWAVAPMQDDAFFRQDRSLPSYVLGATPQVRPADT
jgi:hypothetical protein